MFKNYIVVLFAVLLLLTPARAFAVEGDQNTGTIEENNTGDTYYEEPYTEPWQEENQYQEGNQYDGTYEEPASDNNGYNNGNNEQATTYEEPYVEPYEEPYTEPYVEPYTEPEVEEIPEPEAEPYVEPYIEPVPEPEAAEEPEEIEEEPELSISTVTEEGYNVSGTVSADDEIIGNVELTLSNGDETLETTSDNEGKFTFEGIFNGTYTLSVVESDAYEAVSEPIEVTVNDRNKLGYEMSVTSVEVEAEAEEELPVETAETDERSEETSDSGMSQFELILISVGALLLAITIGIVLFRRFSRR